MFTNAKYIGIMVVRVKGNNQQKANIMKNTIKKIAKAAMLTIVLISVMALAFLALCAASYSVFAVAPFMSLTMAVATIILTIMTPFKMVEFLVDFNLV